MKIFPISDIHSEIFHPRFEFWGVHFKFLHDIDVMVIAGDNSSCINNLTMLTQLLLTFPNLEIVYVLGNHDYYGTLYEHAWESMLWADYAIPKLHVLTGYGSSYWEYNDVVFIGGTLWTDYNKNNANVANVVQRTLNDYKIIMVNGKTISTNFIYNEHCVQKKNIFRLLNKEQFADKKRIVVTHHKPYLSDVITDSSVYGYEVDLEKELNKCKYPPEYWVYGHTHRSEWKEKQYANGVVTFVSNQYGYVHEDVSQTGFHKDCILEV